MLITLVVTALLIAVNWLVYIYAIVSGHVLEGSLGYYLNPLVNVLLGVVLLKERLTRPQVFACLLAGAGVAVLAAGAGLGPVDQPDAGDQLRLLRLPAEGRAGRRARGAVGRDRDPGAGLAGLGASGSRRSGDAGFGAFGAGTDPLLVLGGAVTAIPLLLFTAAAKRLPYSTLGFLQYIAPSLQFLLAVLVFGEPLHRRPCLLLRRDLDRARHLQRRGAARGAGAGRRRRLERRARIGVIFAADRQGRPR